jgi:hypothetical protein
VAGCCEHGDEHAGSIKGSECLDDLSDSYLLKKDLLHEVNCKPPRGLENLIK